MARLNEGALGLREWLDTEWGGGLLFAFEPEFEWAASGPEGFDGYAERDCA